MEKKIQSEMVMYSKIVICQNCSRIKKDFDDSRKKKTLKKYEKLKKTKQKTFSHVPTEAENVLTACKRTSVHQSAKSQCDGNFDLLQLLFQLIITKHLKF